MKKLKLILLGFIFSLGLHAQDSTLERLEQSPRHHEWVEMKVEDKALHSFVVYPERADGAPVIIVIHENRGLTDWVRGMADKLAELGYIAIAPDMLSDSKEGISKTSDYSSSDDARNAIYALEPEFVTAALDAVFKYGKNDPASNGKVSVAGFCWGGSQAFRYSTNNKELLNAFVFYGTAPKEQAAINQIETDVYGFYGENDQRVNATLPETEKMMEEAGNTFNYEIYPAVGHAYMRQAESENANEQLREAYRKSLDRIKKAMQ